MTTQRRRFSLHSRVLALGLLSSLLLALLVPAWPAYLSAWAHPSSPEQMIIRQFPALAEQMAARTDFTVATRTIEGRVVAGFQPHLASTSATPEIGFPTGLLPPERAAWLAQAQRDGMTNQVSLTPFFPASYGDSFVVEGQGMRVVVRPLGAAQVKAQIEQGKVIYRGAYPHTDSLHAVKGHRSEEFLLLHTAEAPHSFEYALQVSAGAKIALAEGAVRLTNERGQGLVIEKPWVVDAQGQRREDVVHWELGSEERNGIHHLRLELTPAGLAYPLVIDPSWVPTSDLVTARHFHTATLLSNGQVLIAGGSNINGSLKSAELYNPATGTWSSTGDLATARESHTATLLPNGQVLIAGGFPGGGGVLKSAELYNPATGAWSSTGDLATARGSHTATLLPNGQVLLAGGEGDSFGFLKSAELYNPATGTWSSTGDLATARGLHTATLLPNGQVLIAGGVNTSSGVLKSAELYNPATGTWSSIGDLATARESHTATLLPNGQVLIAGGFNNGVLKSAELYNPATGTWSSTGDLATARALHTATLLPNGQVLIAGGFPSGGGFFKSAELYNPATGTWSSTGDLATARDSHTATLLPNGQVLIAGGINNNGSLKSAELYDPTISPVTGSWSVTFPNTSRSEHTATLLPNGKVLVAGGFGTGGGLNSAELYDPATSMWSYTGNLNTGRFGHTATLLPNGKVLVAGDISSASAELYDPATGTWSYTGSLSTVRANHTATLLPNGKVLVAAGFNNNAFTYLRSAELYDPATGTWSAAGLLTRDRYVHTATLLPNGKVLVAGGINSLETNGTISAEIYDPGSNSWGAVGSLKYPRSQHTANLLPTGKVLVTGGAGIAGVCELYDPVLTNNWSTTGVLSSSVARTAHTATLLTNGLVLLAGGSDGSGQVATAYLYNPAQGLWATTAPLTAARSQHTATLLPNGKVLVAGGDNPIPFAIAELYAVGLGFNETSRPLLTTATSPLGLGGQLTATGSHFQGVSEASGGNTQSSATNYPVLQLRSLVNEQTSFLLTNPASGWSNLTFTSAPVTGFPQGPALATVFTNGIPSVSKFLQLTSIALSPMSQSFSASSATGSVDVIVPGGFGWTAASNAAWIRITSGGGVFGSGAVGYAVDANPDSTPRSGTLTLAGQTFTVAQGAQFNDVPTNHPFYNFISKLSARRVTLGCGQGNYCPDGNVTREQMAAFIIRALGDFTPPPPAAPRFNDVPPENPFYGFIDEMAVRGITLGCGNGNYCPKDEVTREKMAAFMIRALGIFSLPPPAFQRFLDVPPSNSFYAFIDEMAVRQITLGCGGSSYCPSGVVTRGQMAVFMVRAFGL